MMPILSFVTVLLAGSAFAAPSSHASRREHLTYGRSESIHKREVPQEHSHDLFLTITREFLNKNNPLGIQDPVFGLLGDGAAAAGAGDLTNLACLHQATADQAFTNAKAVKNLRGMAGALVFQALERNSAAVGAVTDLCTDAAANKQIGALTQHQDPASDGAAALNKAVTIELAKQLAGIGADPLLALMSGTFAPGQIGDPTAAGNSCDDEEENLGCAFSQGLMVLDASQEEISSAVAGVSQTFTGTGGIFATDLVDLGSFSTAKVAGSVDLATVVPGATGSKNGNKAAKAAATQAVTNTGCAAQPAATVTTTCSVITTTVAMTQAKNAQATAATSTSNLQTFTGTLGGVAPPVTSSATDRPFTVNGDTFVGLDAALARSCDVQHNACFNAFNSGELSGSTQQCEDQVSDCKAAASSASARRHKRASRRSSQQVHERQATDFGSCSDPSIIFANGLDGRTDPAFEPSNLDDFNHGSALAIGVIAAFICQQLQDSCKAATAVVDTCASASEAAVAATQDQSAADVFNDALVGGGGGAAGVQASMTVSSMVMTMTQCA